MNKTLKAILSGNTFQKDVLNNTKVMELDSALYFTFGEYQTLNNDCEDYELTDEDLDLIIEKFPKLEF